MDFKKLFIGGLCASAVLAGCTKELSAPSVEGNQATVSLGEGLTITGSKGTFGAETKAEYGKGFVPYWEENDELGAAFYSAVDGYDYSTGEVISVAPSQKKFMSNTWFSLSDFENENHSKATFTATANLMAGAYVLYFPFDKNWTVITDKLPVENVATTQTMDLKKGEYAHLGDNIFAYKTYKAVPGGRNLEKDFTLAPVTNVLSLKFRVEDETLMQLAGKIDIAEVVLEGDVMYKKGEVSFPTKELIAADYNSAEFKSEAEYAGTEEVNQIILHVKNAGDGYTITKTGTDNATEPVHISVLPFNVDGKSFKVRVVTSEGRVYESANIAEKNVFFTTGVAGMGQHINLSIALNREETGEIYTEDQFKAQWKKAVEGTTDARLVVGTDLVVKDFPMTKSNEDVKITITSDNDATLKVEGNLTLEDGKLVVDLPLTVGGDFTFGNNASISGKGTLSVTGQTTIDGAGDADIKIVKMGNVAISRTGEFKINGEETEEVGKIVNRGKLTLNNFDIENLENKADKGVVTIGSNVKVIGTLDNYGKISGNSSLTNHGTVNLFNTSAVKIVNAAATSTLSAGTINVKANLTLNAENHSTVVVDAGKNLTILDTYTDNADAKIDATDKDAQVTVGSTKPVAATVNGEIVAGVNTKEVKVVNSTKYNVRYIVNKNSDVNAWVETLAKSSDKDSKKVISEIRATDFVFNTNLCQNYNNVEIMDGAVMLINRPTCNLYANTTVKGNATIKGTVGTASLHLTPTAFYTFLLEKGTLTFDGTLTVEGTLTQEYNTAIKYGTNVQHDAVVETYKKN